MPRNAEVRGCDRTTTRQRLHVKGASRDFRLALVATRHGRATAAHDYGAAGRLGRRILGMPTMTPIRVSLIVFACTVAALAARQAPSEPPRFRVAVDVVAIDAVVTDRDGEVVRDLTAADFEVFQNGKRQKVTFAQFVPVISFAAPATGAGEPNTPPALPPTATPRPPAPSTTGGLVRRTFILVVDDLGLSVEGMNNTRRALRGFVDDGLLPTDLVAIVRTGESRGMQQPLTNDRRALHVTIDALRYN